MDSLLDSRVAGATGSVLDAESLAPGGYESLAPGPSPMDFQRFWEGVAGASMIVRMQVAYQIATDPAWAQRAFKDFSATARLRRIAAVLTGEITVDEA